jgi:hypothetical protein
MKTILFVLVTMFFGMSVFSDAPNKKTTAFVAGTKKSLKTSNEPRLDFILGSWTGTGFITDANGLEQYVEIQENNSSVSNTQYRILGVCKNPGSNFVHAYDKSLFFNPTSKVWYINGKVNNSMLPDSRTTLSENYPFSYTYYYDVNTVRVRYTTTKDTDDSFTEMQEKWGQNGWDKVAWFRMTRVRNN